MTRFGNQANRPVPYRNSKLGQTNAIPSHRVGLIFTMNTAFDQSIDELAEAVPGFQGAAVGGSGTDATTGFGYTAGDRRRIPRFDGQGPGQPVEIVVGGGWRSVNVEQQINVTQEQALGFFDIFETVSHNVASNTMTADKMALRLLLLSQSGIAPFGKDVITSPRLNCYIYDPKERQRGYNVGYLKLFGLHINTNRFNANVGSAVMENVTFRADRIQAVKQLPEGMREELATLFPSIYGGVESLENYALPGVALQANR